MLRLCNSVRPASISAVGYKKRAIVYDKWRGLEEDTTVYGEGEHLVGVGVDRLQLLLPGRESVHFSMSPSILRVETPCQSAGK